MGSVLLFLYQKIVIFVKIICFSLYKYGIALFGSHIFRRDEGCEKDKSESWEISSKIETESKSKHDLGNFSDGFSGKEETEICFQFKFQTYEDFCKSKRDNGENSILEPVKGRGFIKEPDILEIRDNNDEPFGDFEEIKERVLSIDENYVEINSEETKEIPKETEDSENLDEESICSSPLGSYTNRLIDTHSDRFLSNDDFGDGYEFKKDHESLDETPKLDKKEKSSVIEEKLYTIEELRKIEEEHYKILGKAKSEFLSEKYSCGESETHSKSSYSKNRLESAKPDVKKYYAVNVEDDYTIEELRKIEESHYKSIGKFKSEFLPEKDLCGKSKNDSKIADTKNKSKLATLDENEKISINEEDKCTVEELRKIEEAHYKNIGKSKPEFLPGKDFCVESESDSKKSDTINKSNLATLSENENKKIKEAHYKNVGNFKSEFLSEKDFCGDNEFKKAETKNKSEWDSDELWEHQELIEQLKMELKKVKATGLPTILEESESPKIADDLKPWKIDEKLQHADLSGELQKFYKSYADRMRKLDILNYQKMYAIGFLQLKDPLQSISSQRSFLPSVSTLLTHNLFPSKCKKIGNDPMMKFIVELQSDLEIVYVGHMCLSWEILHWQHGKALELWETDPRCVRMYNEVAGDFQQFQVLLQRFIEDEPFQGPRVQNYVKSRCAFRSLLQVPLIKEDNSKDRKKALKRREMGDFAITSDTLVEILEESIRIFWRFVRADKDCSNVMVKSRKGLHVQLQDPSDSELLMEVQANLQKKEKKLKDLLRGGNCILKKFKKVEEEDSDQVLYFFSQVDMKLVGRVLNMPRITTDQLIWCRNKLDKISFVSKKIQVEPSFLLFPC